MISDSSSVSSHAVSTPIDINLVKQTDQFDSLLQREYDSELRDSVSQIAVALMKKDRAKAYEIVKGMAKSSAWYYRHLTQSFVLELPDFKISVSIGGVKVSVDKTTRIPLSVSGEMFELICDSHEEFKSKFREENDIASAFFGVEGEAVIPEEDSPETKALDELFEDMDEPTYTCQVCGTDQHFPGKCKCGGSAVAQGIDFKEIIPPLTPEEEYNLFTETPNYGTATDGVLFSESEDEIKPITSGLEAETLLVQDADDLDDDGDLFETARATVRLATEIKETTEAINAIEREVEIESKLEEAEVPKKYSDKMNEASIEDAQACKPEPKTAAFKTEADKEASAKGTIQYLKSVEGRVLTIMEAAFPNESQRDAVKSLIKKEFRREMTKVNREEMFNEESSDE